MNPQFAVPVTLLLLASCAGGAATRTDGEARPARRQVNLITEEEVQASGRPTVFEAIQALRPMWLTRARPTTVRPEPLIVYMDGTRFGDLDALRQMSVGGVLTIRYYSPGEAQGRFGPGHLQGAIDVITSRGR